MTLFVKKPVDPDQNVWNYLDGLTDTEYLHFLDDPNPVGRKTKIIGIYSVHHGDLLGRIRWHGPWHQYIFDPEPGTIWNPACLTSVMNVIKGMMEERRNGP